MFQLDFGTVLTVL